MAFISENFLLQSKTAQRLYHDFAKDLPVIDYHNHLPPQEIAEDKNFENITQAWLCGDHYKWRAMRMCGVDESYITGNRSDEEKFMKWAVTVPSTLRNPLYHWTHMELERYFGIKKILNENTARKIYDKSSERLRSPEYSVRNLLKQMNVKLLCTTDDPIDSLAFHKKIREDNFEIQVLPAFRPDQAMNISNPDKFKTYLAKLQMSSGISIHSFDRFISALRNRHDFFSSMGCKISDHGLEEMYAEQFTEKSASAIFEKVISGNRPEYKEERVFKSAMLYYFALWDHEKGWIQQYHLGALRNNNSRRLKELGPDTGWDSIGDFQQAASLSKFLDSLDKENKLTKTIIYNLNPADNHMMASMTGNFNDGSVAGKIQWGSSWWFLDQKDGMIQQMNTLSNIGLISKFIGMLTDSRSFLSFPRHEYFRRILCNLFAEDIENGEIPDDTDLCGKIIQDICYNNNVEYFGWKV
ncbi:MAG TPA: glucuronate isomerase [Flavitalea sp.]|nr:glucuronate isomerase [Flavitalea sp.]